MSVVLLPVSCVILEMELVVFHVRPVGEADAFPGMVARFPCPLQDRSENADCGFVVARVMVQGQPVVGTDMFCQL